jgi:hypothetical protein
MQKLEELIAALEKATGPDRWLDAKIDAALRVGTVKMRGGGYEWAWSNFPVWAHHKQHQGMCGVQHANGDLGLVWDSDPFTSSIDAAVALVGRVLPGWVWGISALGDVLLYERDDSPAAYRTKIKLDHPVPAIALCLATLRSKLTQEKNNADK